MIVSESFAQALNFELNNAEYGLIPKKKPESILFQPREFGILDNYKIIKELYNVTLSPTVVSLASHKDTNQVSKSIQKYIREELGIACHSISVYYKSLQTMSHSHLTNNELDCTQTSFMLILN